MQPEDNLKFSEDQSIKSVNAAIDSVKNADGKADFTSLKNYITTETLQDVTVSSKKVLILLTQGESIDSSQLKDLKSQLPGVKMIVISIGDPFDVFGDFDIKIIEKDGNDLPKVLGDLEKAIEILTGILSHEYIEINM